MNLAGVVGKRFDQVPFVPEDIPKYHDLAIGLRAGFLQKLYASLFEPRVVTVKIIGFQNEKDATACLVADCVPLIDRISLGKKQVGFAASRWCDHDPALGGGKSRIFDKPEPEPAHIERNGFIIIWNKQSYGGDMLHHGARRYHVLLALAGKIWIILHAIVVISLWKPVHVSGQRAGLLRIKISQFCRNYGKSSPRWR